MVIVMKEIVKELLSWLTGKRRPHSTQVWFLWVPESLSQVAVPFVIWLFNDSSVSHSQAGEEINLHCSTKPITSSFLMVSLPGDWPHHQLLFRKAEDARCDGWVLAPYMCGASGRTPAVLSQVLVNHRCMPLLPGSAPLAGLGVFEALLIWGCISLLFQSTSTHGLPTALEGRLASALSWLRTAQLVFPQHSCRLRHQPKKRARTAGSRAVSVTLLEAGIFCRCLSSDGGQCSIFPYFLVTKSDSRGTRIWLFTASVSLLHSLTDCTGCLALHYTWASSERKRKGTTDFSKLSYDQFRTQMGT